MVFPTRRYQLRSSRLLVLSNGDERALVKNGAVEIPSPFYEPLNCRDEDDDGKSNDGVVHARASNITSRREKEEDSDHDCVGNAHLLNKLVKG